ncbi:hypothetical protein [Nocardioides montaniterrae]
MRSRLLRSLLATCVALVLATGIGTRADAANGSATDATGENAFESSSRLPAYLDIRAVVARYGDARAIIRTNLVQVGSRTHVTASFHPTHRSGAWVYYTVTVQPGHAAHLVKHTSTDSRYYDETRVACGGLRKAVDTGWHGSITVTIPSACLRGHLTGSAELDAMSCAVTHCVEYYEVADTGTGLTLRRG